MLAIVQFLHPGVEHSHDKGNPSHKSWNNGAHKRKYLTTKSVYIHNNKEVQGDVGFWGEWEADSYVQKLHQSNRAYPKWLHKPYYRTDNFPPLDEPYQNTDPFVFGGTFRYSICLQVRSKGQTSLSTLDRGSLILFGSCVQKEFAVDTVFVVADYEEYCIDDKQSIQKTLSYDEQYINLFTNRMFGEPNPNHINNKRTVRSYKGATYTNQYNGMYSFSPAIPWDENRKEGMPRLTIANENYITPTHQQSFKRTTTDQDAIKLFWEEIVNTSRSRGYVEGVEFYV